MPSLSRSTSDFTDPDRGPIFSPRFGVALLLVEENFSHVHAFDARVLLLESGRIVREGSVAELQADESVMATYLGT